MKLDEMTIGEAREIAAMFNRISTQPKQDAVNPAIGKYCIIRCKLAGVHAGTVETMTSDILVLKNSRRLWQWNSQFCLSEAAKFGINAENSKITSMIETVIIPIHDIGEVILCTEVAQKTIENAKIYKV